MRFPHCVVYERKDKTKKPVTFFNVDIETNSTATVGFSSDIAEEGDQMDVTGISSFLFIPGNYNIIIPGYGDFKITGCRKLQINWNTSHPVYRWWLTLEG